MKTAAHKGKTTSGQNPIRHGDLTSHMKTLLPDTHTQARACGVSASVTLQLSSQFK